AWLPFARDVLGNNLVVDLASGEVFFFDHAEGRGDGHGEQFDAFLREYVQSLESGENIVDPRLGVVSKEPPRIAPAPITPPQLSRTKRIFGIAGVVIYVLGFIALVVWFELRRRR